jgi:MHS family proline/betaine transporter-like MFS transporter
MSKCVQEDVKVTKTNLTKVQKEAIGLLSVGTFLEYFDLMLYVHMAVLLNDLFFSKTDPHSAGLMSALAFCSTFVFRPIGSLVIGWIGDNIGRKITVVITTFMMAITCITMANLPTYAQIGVAATWGVTICRIVQGMSSMEEVIGAELYLTESIDLPQRYPVVASITIFSALGGTAALGIASISTMYGLNWRYAFWIGAVIALIGTVARTVLRETPEFADAKRQLKQDLALASEKGYINIQKVKDNIWNKKVNLKTVVAYFLIQCARPICFYFSYIYCGTILKNLFDYTSEQVIHHSFLLSLVDLLGITLVAYLSSKIYPLNILKIRLVASTGFVLFMPYLLQNITMPIHLFLIQSFFIVFAVDSGPAAPIFYKHFPVFKRFTYASFTYAASRAIMYIITSFGLVYLIEQYSSWGILVIMIPVIVGFAFALLHFLKLERTAGHYSQKSFLSVGKIV